MMMRMICDGLGECRVLQDGGKARHASFVDFAAHHTRLYFYFSLHVLHVS